MNLLEEWTKSAGAIPWERWNQFKEDYYDEIGISQRDVSWFVPQHPAMSGPFQNHVRLLPDDVVPRLRTAEDFDSELRQILTETYERLAADIDGELQALVDVNEQMDDQDVPDINSKSGQLAYLCWILVPQLQGDVNVTRLQQRDTNVPAEPTMDPPDYTGTITVERRNERNMLDVAIFSVANLTEFFSARYGDSTLMMEALIDAEIEPEAVIDDVAFESEGNPWIKTTPPEDPIAFSVTDHKNRAQFFRIDNPKKHYGDAWGDFEEMIEIDNSEKGLEAREFLYDTGKINWQIALGI